MYDHRCHSVQTGLSVSAGRILDEWMLYPLKENEARDVLELVESRS